MLVSNPGAAALRLHGRGFSEEIPAALVREAMQGLPPELPATMTLRRWLSGEDAEPIEQDQLRQVIRELVERAHGRQQDGSISRVPPHAGGRIMAPNDLDPLTMSALTALALALQRFVVLGGGLGTEVRAVARGEGT